MFTVRQIEDKWYFEIPDSVLNRYLLCVTRLTASPQGFNTFGGEKVNEQTVYFEQKDDKRIFLRTVIYRQTADSTANIYAAVANAQVNPIAAVFNVIGRNPKTKEQLIDITDFFKKDNAVTGMPSDFKSEKKLGSLADDRSFIDDIRTYPINVEVKSTKTFTTSAALFPAGAQTGVLTMSMNTSMVLLPKVPMQMRISDPRVGYFTNKFVLFSDDQQRTKDISYIQRYRLEPKPEDLKKYLRGELVEPKKQIVYYIDPATPKQWQPYLIKGINDWNTAFEAAGFKNAIVGKVWPVNDTTMSMEDARYSVIRYYASEKSNAYGPRIWDPRSGEIIESHIGWYHNVMKLLQRWYMVQVGPLDKRAQKIELDEDLMGELIRFVSSHEVGHSLGLRHNMGASSQTPVEKLRDKKWVEANGHTVSIMDYARFNYVAQPEDNIGTKGIFPRIGIYDKWAIKWGYQYLPNFDNGYAEQDFLSKQITDELKANPKLWFGGEGKDEDPRSQSEDLGDDAIKASEYGIKNLKRVVENLVDWTKEPNGKYDDLSDMHKAVQTQYSRYLYHVLKNLGGRYIVQQPGQPVYQEIPKERAKSVIGYLDTQLFDTPLWMYPQDILEKIGVDVDKQILDQQSQILNMVLSSGMMYNLYNASLRSSDPYPLPEYLNDLLAAAWKPLNNDNERKNVYRRSLQRAYLAKLDLIINPNELKEGKLLNSAQQSDIKLYVLQHLKDLEKYIKTELQKQPADSLNYIHYEDLLNDIHRIKYKRNNPL